MAMYEHGALTIGVSAMFQLTLVLAHTLPRALGTLWQFKLMAPFALGVGITTVAVMFHPILVYAFKWQQARISLWHYKPTALFVLGVTTAMGNAIFQATWGLALKLQQMGTPTTTIIGAIGITTASPLPFKPTERCALGATMAKVNAIFLLLHNRA